MADITAITLPNNDTYNFKDSRVSVPVPADAKFTDHVILSFKNVAVTAGTGDIATITDARITSDHEVVGYNIIWGNPSAITTDVTVTTSAGKAVLNGTCKSATTATFQLAIPE